MTKKQAVSVAPYKYHSKVSKSIALVERRLREGYTPKQIAEEIGCTQQSVSYAVRKLGIERSPRYEHQPLVPIGKRKI